MSETQNLLPFERLKKEILVKRQAETSNKFGCRPEDRSTEDYIKHGVVNINKPRGPTSHQVSAYVQKILNINKAGHSGTLDPKVTGVLPIALAKATKVVQALLISGKEYVAIMHLHSEVDEKKIREVCNEFVGKIKQLPPVKSAVKRRERFRRIYYLDVMEIDGQDVLFRVGCQAGTYIRKLCLHPQTELLLKNKISSINDFYSAPQAVYSLNKNKIITRFPSAVQKLYSPKKLIKITMSSGINFITTPDHELLKSCKDDYKMTEAMKLKKGDYLVKSLNFPIAIKDYVIPDLLDDRFLIPQKEIKQKCKKAFIKRYDSIRAMNRKLKIDRKAFLSRSNNAITIRHLKFAGIYEKVKYKINKFKTEKGTIIEMDNLSSKIFYLLGLIASDGNNTKEKNTIRHTRLKFHNKNEELVDKFLNEYKKIFPNFPISKKKIRNNLFQLDTSNSFFAAIAASFGIKSPQKNSDILPILYLKPKFIKAFLRGYFDGDGTAWFKKNQKRNGHYYTDIKLFTISYIFAKRLHQMLLKLNIPNKISYKKNDGMYIVSLESLAAKYKFIKEIGSNEPKKKKILKEIKRLKRDDEIDDYYYLGFHYKEEIRKNKRKLHKMGGNLSRILKSNIPVTKRFYKKCSKIVKLPNSDKLIIEKIKNIEKVNGSDYVYDMTVPKTHNFLIETGFVSSNCHDIGLKLGIRAHMHELIRTKAGPFNESTLVTMQDLQDAFWYYKNENKEDQIRKIIQPMEDAVEHLPKIWVLDTTVNSICNGANLKIPGISKFHSEIQKDELIAIMSLKNELVALAKAKMTSSEIMKKDKGIVASLERVFIEPGIYPRIEK